MAGDDELDFFQPRSPQAPRPRRSRATFPARYPGECRHCGALFDEGDPIAYVDEDVLVDEDCWAAAGE